MIYRWIPRICRLSVLFVSFTTARADEGMWLLDSVGKLPLAEMRAHGLALTPEQIYSTTTPSLKDAVILLTSGSASFISAQGLILTNHHVAFSGIQSHSSVGTDYLNDGFWAKTRDEELSTSYTADIVVDMKDVTDQVLSAAKDSMSPDDRLRAIRSKRLDIEEAAPDTGGLTHSVIDMYSGNRYYLFTFKHLYDVRLVYAPPGPIGNFGGEADNWVWPRHTGDFALMRAYVGPDGRPAPYSTKNVPYQPRAFLPISTQGYNEGSFAMIMGFPGRTYRYYEATSVQLAVDETLPTTADLYRTRIDIIESKSENNRALAITYATRLRRLSNTYKKNIALLEGIRRTNLLGFKQTAEARFSAYVASNPVLSEKYGSILTRLAECSAEMRKVNRKNLFLTNMRSGIDLVRVAHRFINFLDSLPKDSLGNVLQPTEKETASLRRSIGATLKDLDVNIDRETLTALLLKSMELPVDQQLDLCAEIVGNSTGTEREEKVLVYVDKLYKGTALVTQAGCENLLKEGSGEINADVFVGFARQLSAEESKVQATLTRVNDKLAELRGKLTEAWLRWKSVDPSYPDANRTLRFTYGLVNSVSPRDAVRYSHVTTLTGVMEKESGQAPFVVPPRLKELWKKKDFGRYGDPQLGDIPVAFTANLDITGGNSGSPVINGKGELIGCAFDTNWEGVVSDYRYEDTYTRAISVDARYILFVLDRFTGAENILKELVIR